MLPHLCFHRLFAAWAFLAAGTSLRAGDFPATVVFGMDTIRHSSGVFGETKTPVGTVDVVPGTIDAACRFACVPGMARNLGGARGGFFTAPVAATPAWDKAAGISFFVREDVSTGWGA